MTLHGQPAWFAKQLPPVQCRPPPQSSDALQPRVPCVGQTAAVGSTTGTTSFLPPHAANTKIAETSVVSALGSTRSLYNGLRLGRWRTQHFTCRLVGIPIDLPVMRRLSGERDAVDLVRLGQEQTLAVSTTEVAFTDVAYCLLATDITIQVMDIYL